jgi:hypothetical protein
MIYHTYSDMVPDKWQKSDRRNEGMSLILVWGLENVEYSLSSGERENFK